MPRTVTAEEVQRVWEAWRVRQKRPDLVRFTDERDKLIRKRLALGYSADDFVALVRFGYEADDDRARFWRGENPDRRTYLDLENLLRLEKLGARIPVAVAWAEGSSGGDPGGSAPPAAGLRRGGTTRRSIRRS